MASGRVFDCCCGVIEVGDFDRDEHPAKVIGEFCNDEYGKGPERVAHVVFTDIVKRGKPSPGFQLAAYITKERLGTVIQSQPQKGSTQNKIVTFVWTPDIKALRKWWTKHERAYDWQTRECGDPYDGDSTNYDKDDDK